MFVDPPDGEAASVTLQSEQGQVVVFCHPCDLSVGDIIENRLSVLDAEVRSAYLTDWPNGDKETHSLQRLERIGHYSYRGVGHVLDQSHGLVEVKGFVIEMDVLYEGPVEFEISRLDLVR